MLAEYDEKICFEDRAEFHPSWPYSFMTLIVIANCIRIDHKPQIFSRKKEKNKSIFYCTIVSSLKQSYLKLTCQFNRQVLESTLRILYTMHAHEAVFYMTRLSDIKRNQK